MDPLQAQADTPAKMSRLSKSPQPVDLQQLVEDVQPMARQVWSSYEQKQLVQLLALRALDDGSQWPATKAQHFWDSLAVQLQSMAGTSFLREGMSLRSKVGKLRSLYGTLQKAEEEVGLSLDSYIVGSCPEAAVVSPQHKKDDGLIQLLPLSLQQLELVCRHANIEDLEAGIDLFFKKLCILSRSKAVSLLDRLASDVSDECVSILSNSNHGNIVSSSLDAMKSLAKAGKDPMLVTKFAKCISTKRPDTNTSLMPLNRMPFALMEYQIEFFTATHVSKVRESPAFRLWRETMCAELTGSQNRLLRGPGWSGRDVSQFHDPLAARVNVACVSTKTVNKKLAESSEVSTEPVIQQASIKALVHAGIKRVWLKADACDLKLCLQHSRTGQWNGDEDMGNGRLADLRQEYEARVATCNWTDLQGVQRHLECDVVFLRKSLVDALKNYQTMQAARTSRTEALTEAMWTVADLNMLLQQAESFLQLFQKDIKPVNIKKVKEKYFTYIADLYKKHRTPATHVLIFLASDERRNKKPYSVPLQYLPIKSIRDQYIRDFTSPLKAALKEAGITVVGTTTDGEFCSLRSLGDSRPTHIWQLVKDCRLAVSRMKKERLENLLFPVRLTEDGQLVMAESHPAVHNETVLQMYARQQELGWTRTQCIHEQRMALIPQGFPVHPFRRNTPESYLDELRSLVATYMFRHVMEDWAMQGVDFKHHLYVPETDKITGVVHHERADHCHLLKRIATHTRELRYAPLTQEPFVAAMMSPDTGLNHVALAGLRKQSVEDAEHLLSYRVAADMERRGHLVAAEYVSIIAGWHEASDGRGLSEPERAAKNQRMLKYLVDDWIPYQAHIPDYSMLDINRPMDNIRGFSRETFVEVTVNIESQELRRSQSAIYGPEHPRAGTTDDCENFFAICHRYMGPHFTLRDFKYRWRKIVSEFEKKMDPELPFYYWTPTGRYTEEEEDFNDPVHVPVDVAPREDPRRLHRLVVNRREDASVFAVERAYMPHRYAQSIRRKFHAVPSVQDLPPVPQHMLPEGMDIDI